MTNPFSVLCQPYLNRILTSDRVNVSKSVPLGYRNSYGEGSSWTTVPKATYPSGSSTNTNASRTVAPQKLGLESLHPLRLLGKQASALAQPSTSAAKLHRRKSLRIRVLSTLGCLTGLTALLVGCSSDSGSDSALSDSPSPFSSVSSMSVKDIKSYANAVLEIDQRRQAAYNDIQNLPNDEKISSDKISDITCTKADSLAALPKSIQDIAVKYCNQAKQLVKDQGLTISQFNEITKSTQSNPELQKRIRNELLRLKK